MQKSILYLLCVLLGIINILYTQNNKNIFSESIKNYVKKLLDIELIHCQFLQILQKHKTLEEILKEIHQQNGINYYKAAEKIIKNLNITKNHEINTILEQYQDQENLFEKPSFASSFGNIINIDLDTIHKKFFIELLFANQMINKIVRETIKEQGTDYYQAAQNVVKNLNLEWTNMIQTVLNNLGTDFQTTDIFQTLSAPIPDRTNILLAVKKLQALGYKYSAQDTLKILNLHERITKILDLYKNQEKAKTFQKPFGKSFEETLIRHMSAYLKTTEEKIASYIKVITEEPKYISTEKTAHTPGSTESYKHNTHNSSHHTTKTHIEKIILSIVLITVLATYFYISQIKDT